MRFAMSRSIGSAQRAQKRLVFANVIIRIVKLRSEYQQRRVGAVLPLPAPDHRRDIDTRARTVQHDLAARRSVIDRDAALTIGADQKLMALLVGVLATDSTGWNAGNDEIPLGTKWKFVFEFADRQVSARVLHRRKPVKNHPAHPNG